MSKIVTVTTTSPSGDTNILSIPLGPKEVLRVEATALAAAMLLYIFKNI